MKINKSLNKIFRNRLILKKRKKVPLINEIKFELFYTYIKNLDYLYYEMRPVSKSEFFTLNEFNTKKNQLMNDLFYKIPFKYIILLLSILLISISLFLFILLDEIDITIYILKEILKLTNIIELNDFVSTSLSILF